MTTHTQDPALALLEQARAAHAAAQTRKPSFATAAIPAPPNELPDRQTRMQANRELTAAIPAARRLNIIYAPLLAKTLCSDICSTIQQMLRDNRVTDTKSSTAYLKRWREVWEEELYSPDMPEGAETVIRTLTQWWRDDGTDTILSSLRYAYSNHLGRIKGIHTNTADFLAWIFTARDIARASARFDDNSLAYLRTLPQAAPFRLRRNAEDYAYKLDTFCTSLIKSAFGSDPAVDPPAVLTGRDALYNRLALYDAATALSHYWAVEGRQRAGKTCPAERCALCTLRADCKTLKSVLNKMTKK